MFEQHPVPQQISSYSFKLVGNMTLKQFFQVAGGAIVALIVYALPLAVYVKWPLILLSAVAGAAFAFLPIQDRPLEQWLLAFFRSIYSPTVFVWNAQASAFPYFKEDNVAPATPMQQQIQAQLIQQELDKNTKKEETDPEFVKNLDEKESDKLNQIANMMENKPAQDQLPKGEMVGAETGDITVSSPTPVQTQVQEKPKEELQVPVEQRVATEKKGFEMPKEIKASNNVQQAHLGEVFNAQDTQVASQAQFSESAAPPMRPSQTNVLVGQVLDSGGKIVEGAILEVKDKMGIPVRALKTNKAGHFMTVTPLNDGQYNVIVEKEGFSFDPVSVELNGQIVEPLAIKAK